MKTFKKENYKELLIKTQQEILETRLRLTDLTQRESFILKHIGYVNIK